MKTIIIENKAGKVKLNEVVTRESIGRMIDEIGKLFGAKASAEGADFGEIMNAAENAVDILDIEINSPGGSVFDGYTIYQEIKSLQDRGVIVNATITGMAASMASVICMACDRVSIVPHGRMMIHDASNSVHGNADELRKAADLLDSISGDIADIYSNRTGKPVDEIRELMKAETWMNADTCIAFGFVDSVIGRKAQKQAVDIGGENTNVGSMSLLSRLTSPSNEEAAARIEALETQILGHDTEVSELQAKLDTAELALQEASEIAARNIELEAQALTIPDFEAKVTELEAKVTDLEASNAVTNEKIEAAAAAKLAAMGHGEPLDLGSAGIINTAPSHLETFNSLKGREASAYFAKFEAEIAEEQKAERIK